MKISPVPKDDYDVQETRETSFDGLDKILNVAENAVIEREKPAKNTRKSCEKKHLLSA